jgi:hypothetical protein
VFGPPADLFAGFRADFFGDLLADFLAGFLVGLLADLLDALDDFERAFFFAMIEFKGKSHSTIYRARHERRLNSRTLNVPIRSGLQRRQVVIIPFFS